MAERLALVAALNRRAALGERQDAVGDRVGHLVQRQIRQVVDVVARLVIALVVRAKAMAYLVLLMLPTYPLLCVNLPPRENADMYNVA